jgi:hypothetical protein
MVTAMGLGRTMSGAPRAATSNGGSGPGRETVADSAPERGDSDETNL